MEVKTIALKHALKYLKAADVKFAVIDQNGVKHGDLEIATPKEQRRQPSRFPRGAFIGHFLPMVKDMKAGDSVLVPFGPFGQDNQTKEQLRSALSSHCSGTWGNKTYITHTTPQGIELLRVE